MKKKTFVLLPTIILTIITSYLFYIYGNKYLSQKKTITYIEYALPTVIDKNIIAKKFKKTAFNSEILTINQQKIIDDIFRFYVIFYKNEIEKTILNYVTMNNIKHYVIDTNVRLRSIFFTIEHKKSKEEFSKIFNTLDLILYKKFITTYAYSNSEFNLNKFFSKNLQGIIPPREFSKITIEDKNGNAYVINLNNGPIKEFNQAIAAFPEIFNEKFFLESNRIRYEDKTTKQIQLPLTIFLSLIYFLFYFIIFSLLSKKFNL